VSATSTSKIREAMYDPRSASIDEKDLLALNEVDMLRIGAADFDHLRDMHIYIDLGDRIVELIEATSKPGQWRASVTVGGETRETTVHVLHGRLRRVWRAVSMARQRARFQKRAG
jgi:hypothetical protein